MIINLSAEMTSVIARCLGELTQDQLASITYTDGHGYTVDGTDAYELFKDIISTGANL